MKTKGEARWWKPSGDWSLRSLLAVIVVLVLMPILVPLIAIVLLVRFITGVYLHVGSQDLPLLCAVSR
jgi:uncharacterized membrane protein YdfJ with MMPL/SSD domain